MKKFFLAIVATVMMSMSANAQSVNRLFNFNKVADYLELTAQQFEPAKTAIAQFEAMKQACDNVQDKSESAEARSRVLNKHKVAMKKVLTQKQYDKYVGLLELTLKNQAEQQNIQP